MAAALLFHAAKHSIAAGISKVNPGAAHRVADPGATSPNGISFAGKRDAWL